MQNYGKKIFGLVMDSFRESRPGIVSVQDRMIIIKVIIVVSSNETFLRNFKHFKCFFAYVFFLLHQMAITLYSYWRFGYTIAFYVLYQMACITLITLVLPLAHSCFGNYVGNLFWSISQSSIWSTQLWSIHHENDDWPNFFGDLAFGRSELFCFQLRLTKSHLVNLGPTI